MKTKHYLSVLLVLVGVTFLLTSCSSLFQKRWNEDELAALRSLWIGNLPPLPHDPSNKYADNPQAAAFGQRLFFDTRFSSNGKVACSTCHQPDKLFQDDLPLSNGVGTTNRRAMTIIGTAYSPWLFWDGRKDSQWAQATGPMESAVEHGGNRTQYAHLIDQSYRAEYEAIFGPLPDLSGLPANAGPIADPTAKAAWESMSEAERVNVSRIYADMGKAIAAYERKIMPGPAKFDRYVEAILQDDLATARAIYTPDEAAGLRLFIGRGDCTNCHNSPLFTNNDFHNTGVPAAPDLPEDIGRAKGIQQVVTDEFNCVSQYSDAGKTDCGELRFIRTDDDHDLTRQFKPPSLRNVAERAPYMDAGQFKTLDEVLNHYSHAPEAPAGHSELKPLNLSDAEKQQLVAFLKTLSGPLATAPDWLKAPGN